MSGRKKIYGKKSGRKAMKGKLAPLMLMCLAGLLVFQFTRLDESRKRFILHLLKQVPYLPGRYFA